MAESKKEFKSKLVALQSRFEATATEVGRRELALKGALDDFMREAHGAKIPSVPGFAEDNPLVIAVNGYQTTLEARAAVWKREVENQDRNTEFRKHFDDSLLVYVYGKVNAGKSSLGNYVAGDSKGAEFFLWNELSGTTSPLVSAEKFPVKETETTKDIQGFRIPGLTWVDSPGIHSVTREHGELAKKYQDSADIILFVMNSAHPGRDSDMAEISMLLAKHKPFLALICRCDTIELDEMPDGEIVKQLFMKSDKDRHDQEECVLNEVILRAAKQQSDLVSTKILTNSVTYAERHEGNEKEYERSGLAEFYRELGRVAENDGVRLKAQRPLVAMRAFGEKLVAPEGELSVACLRAAVSEISGQIRKQRGELAQRKLQVQSRTGIALDAAVSSTIQNNKGADSRTIGGLLSDKATAILREELNASLNEVIENVDEAVQKATHFSELCEVPEFQQLTKSIQIMRKPQGKAAGKTVGKIIGTVAGGVIGFFLGGGIPGAAAGAKIGSTVGGKGGAPIGKWLTNDRQVEVPIGDNLDQVRAGALASLSQQLDRRVDSAFSAFERVYLLPVEAYGNQITILLDKLETRVRKEVLK